MYQFLVNVSKSYKMIITFEFLSSSLFICESLWKYQLYHSFYRDKIPFFLLMLFVLIFILSNVNIAVSIFCCCYFPCNPFVFILSALLPSRHVYGRRVYLSIQFCSLCLLTGELNPLIVNDIFRIISTILCFMFTIFFLFTSWPSIEVLKPFLYGPSFFYFWELHIALLLLLLLSLLLF